MTKRGARRRSQSSPRFRSNRVSRPRSRSRRSLEKSLRAGKNIKKTPKKVKKNEKKEKEKEKGKYGVYRWPGPHFTDREQCQNIEELMLVEREYFNTSLPKKKPRKAEVKTKKDEEKEEEMHDYLDHMQGMCIYECGGNGNCMFYCIWEGLNYADMSYHFLSLSSPSFSKTKEKEKEKGKEKKCCFGEITGVLGPKEALFFAEKETPEQRQERKERGMLLLRKIASDNIIDHLKKVYPHKKLAHAIADAFDDDVKKIEGGDFLEQMKKDEELGKSWIQENMKRSENGVWGNRESLGILSKHLNVDLLVLSFHQKDPKYVKTAKGLVEKFDTCHIVDPRVGVELTIPEIKDTNDKKNIVGAIYLFRPSSHYQIIGYNEPLAIHKEKEDDEKINGGEMYERNNNIAAAASVYNVPQLFFRKGREYIKEAGIGFPEQFKVNMDHFLFGQDKKTRCNK